MILPTVDELNEIQTAWMALQCDAPEAEKRRVFRLMERYPRTYVSGHDGQGVCLIDGQPMSMTTDFAVALKTCRELGGRTDVAWNGSAGKWYSLR